MLHYHLIEVIFFGTSLYTYLVLLKFIFSVSDMLMYLLSLLFFLVFFSFVANKLIVNSNHSQFFVESDPALVILELFKRNRLHITVLRYFFYISKF
jgi:hypothetical protein